MASNAGAGYDGFSYSLAGDTAFSQSFMKKIFVYFLLFYIPIFADDCALLTLQKSFNIALDQNPRKRAAKEGVLASRETALAAIAPFYPDLWGLASFRRFRDHIFLPPIQTIFPVVIPSFIGPIDDWTFNLHSRWVVFDSGLRRARLLKARSNSYLAADQAEAITQAILLQVADSFFSVLSSVNSRESAFSNLMRAKDHIQIAEKRVKVGDAAPIDLFRTKTEYAQAELELYRAEASLKLAQGALNVSMGLAPECAFEIDRDAKFCADLSKANLNQALDAAYSLRPELHASLQKISVVEETIHEIQSEYGPTIVANGLYGRHDSMFWPHDKQWSVGLSVELPIFEGFRTTHSLRRAKHELSQAQAEYDETALKVLQDVWNAHARLVESNQAITTSEASLLYAKEAHRLAKKRYEAGAGTLNELLDANAVLYDTDRQTITSRLDFQTAYASFLWSSGKIWELLHLSTSEKSSEDCIF